MGANAVEISGKCIVCDSSCVARHCTGPEPTDCTACKVNGAVLSGTPELCLCPAGTYLDTTDTAGDRCLRCNEDCETCYGQVIVNVLPVIPITLKLTQPSTKASVSVLASRVMSITSSLIYVWERVQKQVLTS